MTNGNETAYPEVQETPQFNRHTYGLTKREYFAAMILSGLAGNSSETSAAADTASGFKNLAHVAVNFADSLIEELNTPKESL